MPKDATGEESEGATEIEILRDLVLLYQELHATKEAKEMKGLLGKVKRFWNEVQAVVDPQMVAVTDNGIIMHWVDSRTGETPWFS